MNKEEKIKKAIHEARKKNKKASDFESDNGDARCVAAMSEEKYAEMIDKCGNDREKQDKFLRDNPEHLTASAREHKLSKKRTVIPLS